MTPHIRDCRIAEIPEDSEIYDLACAYAMKPIETHCKCGTVGRGSQMELEKVGWVMNRQVGEVCPQCSVVTGPLTYAFGVL